MKDTYQVEQECINRLGEIPGFDVRRGEGGAAGFDVEIIPQGRPDCRLVLELKATLKADVVLPHIRQTRADARVAICARYANKRQAAELREKGELFIDTVGNMFIQGEGIYLYVTGNTPDLNVGPGRTARVFQKAGLKLIWALLRDPKTLRRTDREIARRAGIAHGAINRQLAGLEELGFIRFRRRERRRLEQARLLLERWLQGYVERLRPQLLVGTYRTQGDMLDLLERVRRFPEDIRPVVGGELAATIMHPNLLMPGTATLHILPEQEGRLQRLYTDLRLAPTNKDPNVFVVRSLGEAVNQDNTLDVRVADPVQTLGELAMQETKRLDEMRDALVTDIMARIDDCDA